MMKWKTYHQWRIYNHLANFNVSRKCKRSCDAPKQTSVQHHESNNDGIITIITTNGIVQQVSKPLPTAISEPEIGSWPGAVSLLAPVLLNHEVGVSFGPNLQNLQIGQLILRGIFRQKMISKRHNCEMSDWGCSIPVECTNHEVWSWTSDTTS